MEGGGILSAAALFLLGTLQALHAQKNPFLEQIRNFPQEKIHVTTDRDAYIAGDTVWLRAHCVDAATRKVEKQFKFKFGDWPSEVQLNGTRDTLYFINKAIWRLPVTATNFPVKPFVPYQNTLYYGLTVNPFNSEVYVADAIDYVQDGVILRYSPEGELLDEFYVGIIPGAFCWR